MNIDQLATREEQWLKKQRSLVGDKETLFEQAGVYAAWQGIFVQYVSLAQKGDLEALKRALYFIWAEHAIGHLITGFKDLDKDGARETLDVAERLVTDGRLDAELDWMLSYYYVVDRSYLDRFEGLDALKRASSQHPFLYRRLCLEASFNRRGQMGEYWKTEQTHLRRWS